MDNLRVGNLEIGFYSEGEKKPLVVADEVLHLEGKLEHPEGGVVIEY